MTRPERMRQRLAPAVVLGGLTPPATGAINRSKPPEISPPWVAGGISSAAVGAVAKTLLGRRRVDYARRFS